MSLGHTYSSVFIQVVFAVSRREKLIHYSWENELYKFTSAIIKRRGHTCIAVNGMPDHIHILIRLSTQESISSLVREIKKATTKKIQREYLRFTSFSWQRGYSVFSYTERDVEMIKNYIRKQKWHHRSKDYRSELKEISPQS